MASKISRLWRSFRAATPCRGLASRSAPPVDPNKFYGLNTKFGWLAVPKQYYASHWTVDGFYKRLDEKFPDADKAALSHGQLQDVVDEWVKNTPLASKPKSNKVTRAEKQAKEDYNLFRMQVRVASDPLVTADDLSSPFEKPVRSRQRLPEAVKEQRKQALKLRRQSQSVTRQAALDYMKEHNALPPDYDFKTVTLTHAWNHYMAKYYSSFEGDDARQQISVKWKSLSKHEKQTYKDEYIELLKKGQAYHCGELISLSAKAKKNR